MCAPIEKNEKCNDSCAFIQNGLDDNNGHCRTCIDTSSPGAYYPGWQPPKGGPP